MKHYLSRVYGFENKVDEDCLQFLTRLWQHTRGIGDQGASCTSEENVYPIVYFNVDGEILPILRSVFKCISDSQLGIRISGRWKEQEETGDIV
jgi:hypothetical protein